LDASRRFFDYSIIDAETSLFAERRFFIDVGDAGLIDLTGFIAFAV